MSTQERIPNTDDLHYGLEQTVKAVACVVQDDHEARKLLYDMLLDLTIRMEGLIIEHTVTIGKPARMRLLADQRANRRAIHIRQQPWRKLRDTDRVEAIV